MRCMTVELFLLLVSIQAFSLAAEKDPSEYPYEWRVADGRQRVLWLGGGHWHETLETAARLRRVLERDGRFHVTYSEDCQVLTRLDRYDAILIQAMLDSLTPEEERGLIAAVRGGEPLLVLHAASASFVKPPPAARNDPPAEHPDFYAMLGGYVQRHPPFGPVTVRVVAKDHPVTRGIGDFVIEDELFLFRNLQADNHVLLEADFQGTPRPLAWTRRCGQGKVLMIALGHGPKAAANASFQRLLVQGFDWLVAKEKEST
ncbi:MAG: ThuA domain-containing protein [Pirellulaceae bacterium]|nr:ThuA domain-containing protein [Pirellulaceae bacterium]